MLIRCMRAAYLNIYLFSSSYHNPNFNTSRLTASDFTVVFSVGVLKYGVDRQSGQLEGVYPKLLVKLMDDGSRTAKLRKLIICLHYNYVLCPQPLQTTSHQPGHTTQQHWKTTTFICVNHWVNTASNTWLRTHAHASLISWGHAAKLSPLSHIRT